MNPDLRALAGEAALARLESKLLDALEVTNAILKAIQKNMYGGCVDVSYPQLSGVFYTEIPRNAAPLAKARA